MLQDLPEAIVNSHWGITLEADESRRRGLIAGLSPEACRGLAAAACWSP